MEVLGALARVLLVFGLLAVVLWVLKRTGGVGPRRTAAVQVVGTARLAKGAALTVVRLDGRELVLGVTEHTVTLLDGAAAAHGSPPAVEAAATSTESASASATAATPTAPEQPVSPDEARALPPAVAVAREVGRRVIALWFPNRVAPATAKPAGSPASLTRSSSTELSPAAVATALALATGRPVPMVPQPRPAAPAGLDADGSASTSTPRTSSVRTDALLDEEHPWTRACRPAFRAAERPPALR